MISKFSVKKPFTILVGVLLAIVLGIVSLPRMTTDLLPDMSLQYVLIMTTDMGASPEKVEMEVTAPIEAAMATTTGIKNISSMSYNSYSIVTCEYDQNVNMDSVVIEIQQSLDQLSGNWGDHVGSPMIMQINPDMLPVMTAAVNVEGMDGLELASYVENELSPSLESLEGVASVTTTGQLEESIVITLDTTKIQALNTLVQKEIKGEFAGPEKEIDSAISKVEEGKQAMADGSDGLGQMLDATMDGRDQLKQVKNQLLEQKANLEMQKKQLEDTLAALEPKINEALEQRNVLVKNIADLEKTRDELKKAIPMLEGQLEEINGQIEALKGQLAGAQAPQPTQNPQTTEMPQLTLEAGGVPSEEEVPSEGEQPSENVPEQNGSIEQQLAIAEAAKLEIEGKLKEAKENLATVEAGYQQAKEMLKQFDQMLVEQFSQLNASGLVQVQSVEDLSKIAPALRSAIAQLDAGITEINKALEQVEEQSAMIPEIMDTMNAEGIKAALEMAPASAELAVTANKLQDTKISLEQAKEQALDAADMKGIITVDTISGILMAQNFDMPAGYAYDGDTQYLVRVGEGVKSIEELENLVLMDLGMESVGIIRLKDVANIEVLDNSNETYAIINGSPGIILSFEKQTGYSTGEVTKRILDKFESLEKNVTGLNLTVLMDQGVYIDMVVDSVIENMIVGAILAVLVLILFLKDWRPTVVIACSIPLSVITAIVLMYFMDISLNIISMSGLMLGIGMLVDNSIVVIENIYRLRNEGLSIRKACVVGADQVAGAIAASTLTTVSVYVPIVFAEGITRQLFVDLALTVAFTLIASLVVAMTVVPAMSSFTLRKTKEVQTPWFDKISSCYGVLLEKSLHKKALVLLMAVVLLVGSTVLCLAKGMTFMDMEMETNQLTVTIGPKEGERFTFEELTACSNEVMEKISGIEGIGTIGATAGGDSTMNLLGGGTDTVTMYILLEEDTKRTTAQISEEITACTKDMECVVEVGGSSSDMTALFGSGLSIKIKGNDLNKLKELAAEVAKIVEETEGTVDIEDGLDDMTPQWTILVDKEKAAGYGLTVAQVYQLVYGEMASSSSATTISTDWKDYKVYLQTEGQSELQLGDIKTMTYTYTDKEGNEKEIPITDFCTMEETTTLSTIHRDAQTRYITVSCGIDEQHNITLVSNEVQEKLARLELPEGYKIEMAGEDETINDSMEQLVLMLVLSIVFIYLIMVAQFQSLKSPFIILFTIPLAFTGGFLALFLSGKELSIIAMLGFIMLAGVIVNNGIVLIDYINQVRAEGKSKKEAILEAGITRLRPILMTALTTILAMSTSAVGMGENSAMMQPMAITMVGGLVYGTLLTLFVIPCIYDLFNKEKSMVEEEL